MLKNWRCITWQIRSMTSVVVDSRKKTRESGHRFVVFSFIYPRSFESKERYILNKYKKFNLVIDIKRGSNNVSYFTIVVSVIKFARVLSRLMRRAGGRAELSLSVGPAGGRTSVWPIFWLLHWGYYLCLGVWCRPADLHLVCSN